MLFNPTLPYKMHNPLQNYAWGSAHLLSDYFAWRNPQAEPQAEVWMGAHANGCSQLCLDDGSTLSLADALARHGAAMLGARTWQRFHGLPYLFKILAAAAPLSIQVHPSLAQARVGFARENSAGLALNASTRNYKDANHKPELIYALTPFRALNGFRPMCDMLTRLTPLSGVVALAPVLAHFKHEQNASTLRALFSALLSLQGVAQSEAIQALRHFLAQNKAQEEWRGVHELLACYPHDNGVFAALLLTEVRMSPGQAMFLPAQTPHAYLDGLGLEVMANSDNVLRAGLTPKHIDVGELLANVNFVAQDLPCLFADSAQCGSEQRFAVPVDDFRFSLFELSQNPRACLDAAAILLCVNGHCVLQAGNVARALAAGESCFVPAYCAFTLAGEGRVAQVTC